MQPVKARENKSTRRQSDAVRSLTLVLAAVAHLPPFGSSLLQDLVQLPLAHDELPEQPRTWTVVPDLVVRFLVLLATVNLLTLLIR
jgi:hypothetical protein